MSALARLDHCWHKRFQHIYGAHQIDIQQLLPMTELHVLNTSPSGNTCYVHQYINTASQAMHLYRKLCYLGMVGNVKGLTMSDPTTLCHDVIHCGTKLVLIHITQKKHSPFPGKTHGCRATNTTGCSG